MSDTTTTPKKSNLKKILTTISAILILVLGVNHFTVKVGYAELGIAVSDSTAAITIAPSEVLPIDTLKTDTISK